MIDKIANAERLAEISRETSASYAEHGMPKMAAHHAYKAEQWAATAADLRAGEAVA